MASTRVAAPAPCCWYTGAVLGFESQIAVVHAHSMAYDQLHLLSFWLFVFCAGCYCLAAGGGGGGGGGNKTLNQTWWRQDPEPDMVETRP